MLKGKRTYITIVLAAAVNLARVSGVDIDPEVESAITVLLLAVAAYFRSEA